MVNRLCFNCRRPKEIVDSEGIKSEPLCEDCYNG